MERKYAVMFAVLGILVLLLAGCQGYKPPKYKSPDSEVEDLDEDLEEAEEVDIDLSELEEEEAEEADASEEEYVDLDEVVEEDSEEPEYEYRYEDEAEEEEVEPYVEPAATVEENSKDDYVEAEYETLDESEDEAEFKKAPYQPLNDEFDDDIPTITVNEGEVVKVNVKATDQDGDTLSYVFGSPLNSEGEWRTRIGDAGLYYSNIIVSDGKEDVTKKVRIVVQPENNRPELEVASRIEVDEGETVELNPRTYDADGDRLTVSYSGWMTTDTKTASYQDSGEHIVQVSVTDGISTVSQDVTVVVNDVNRPPEVEIEF